MEKENLEKEYNKLLEENKKLKAELWEKIDTIQVLIREKYEEKGEKLELFKENKKLKAELEEVEKDLQHRDSFFSIMYDVLGNENVSSYLLYDIVNAVVKSECWAEEELDEEDLDCLKKFWEWFYKRF